MSYNSQHRKEQIQRRKTVGIRYHQFIGLNPWAQKFVLGETVPVTEVVTHIFPDSHTEEITRREVVHSFIKVEPSGDVAGGMMSDGEDDYDLHKYTFPDGRVYFEKVQAQPWSSGPCTFTALQDEKGTWISESLWDDEKIQAA